MTTGEALTMLDGLVAGEAGPAIVEPDGLLRIARERHQHRRAGCAVVSLVVEGVSGSAEPAAAFAVSIMVWKSCPAGASVAIVARARRRRSARSR
jgi:hypothetical protein